MFMIAIKFERIALNVTGVNLMLAISDYACARSRGD
jgi:hypothetical protein